MFNILKKTQVHSSVPLYFFNTLSNKKEEFKVRVGNKVTMYNCGPTVYDFQHIGNMRPYIFADILKRTLTYNGYEVKQVINITDVGHLVSDADDGEDKMEKGARKHGKTAQEVANEVTNVFTEDLKKLNVQTNEIIFPKATQHIEEQIVFIKTLEEKGYTYTTSDGVYFNTALFKTYGKLGNIDLEGLKEGARVEENKEKKNPTDFALWKLSRRDEKRQQEWKSPWGVGYPGWHIECSAMSMKHLGKQIDIHTGGIDHIPIHHNNEIAQSEVATGKQFVNYWLHSAFITIDGRKIAKSIGNTVYLRNIIDKGYSPLVYRYWLLTGHYHTQMNFTWDALEGAQKALFKMHRTLTEELGSKNGTISKTYQVKFHTLINDNLDTPRAIALLWDMLKDTKISNEDTRATILHFDTVLGLGLAKSDKQMLNLLAGKERKLSIGEIPSDVKELLTQREEARKNKKWEEADSLRDKIHNTGFEIDDTDKGAVLRKI